MSKGLMQLSDPRRRFKLGDVIQVWRRQAEWVEAIVQGFYVREKLHGGRDVNVVAKCTNGEVLIRQIRPGRVRPVFMQERTR